MGDSFGPLRTPEYRPIVVAGFGACREGPVAAGVESASVLVAAPAGTTKLPLVPAGFSETGVVADDRVPAVSRVAAAAEATAAARAEPEPSGAPDGSARADAQGGAGGGGLSSTTAVVLAVVGGAGLGAGVAAIGGGDGGMGAGGETGQPSPPGPSLTGQWVGDLGTTWASSCTVVTRYTIDLTQTGRASRARPARS